MILYFKKSIYLNLHRRNDNLLFHVKAQVISEYAVLFFLVIAVITGMTAYLRRTLQGRIREAHQTMINTFADTYYKQPNTSTYNMVYQYEPYYTQTSSVNTNDSTTNDHLFGGPITTIGTFNKEILSVTNSRTNSQQLPPTDARSLFPN